MNIDLAALRALEREREIPFETILAAIETALLTAYRHTEGAQAHARVEIDRKTGGALVYAQEVDEEGEITREYDDTPHDFGRIAAMTAKQVILQRLREATDEVHFGEYVGRDGDLVTGVIQAHEARTEKGIVTVDLGKLEAVLPQSEQVPGEVYGHGQRIPLRTQRRPAGDARSRDGETDPGQRFAGRRREPGRRHRRRCGRAGRGLPRAAGAGRRDPGARPGLDQL
ncbi:MAG TPA: NusA N-terminal domain-containing protein, partial [Asanoa sp.]|nr:NusA N-terminal domain-containing protein [Asanoa sp.]